MVRDRPPRFRKLRAEIVCGFLERAWAPVGMALAGERLEIPPNSKMNW
jgi:hypothetical protein